MPEILSFLAGVFLVWLIVANVIKKLDDEQ
jgi:hypothetical protein